MRKPHVLKGISRFEAPRRLLVFDTETELVQKGEITEHFFKLGWAVYHDLDTGKTREIFLEDQYFIWHLIERFVSNKTRLWVVAHNIVYDMVVCQLFKYLEKKRWYTKKLIVDDGVTYIKCRRGEKLLTFFDTYNLSRAPLADIGKWVGRAKGEIDFDQPTDFNELSTYCLNDVHICLDFLKWWIETIKKNQLGPIQPTVASQAFAGFRTKHMTDKIYIHDIAPVLELERAGYSGGRVELFYQGKKSGEPFYIVDINSCYPAVMLAERYPVKHRGYWPRGCSVDRLKSLLADGLLVVARVKVQADQPNIPKKADKLIFPVGSFETVLTTPELLLSLRNVIDVCQLATYDGAYIFQSYVADLHGLKQTSTGVERQIYKILLNSLYGKFGQKSGSWVDLIDAPKIESDEIRVWQHFRKTGEIVTMRQIGGIIQEKQPKEESYHSFPAIAAHVTGAGRVLLWRYMEAAGLENVFYCDTDSLIINQAGFNRLSDLKFINNDLGGLEVEKESSSFEIQGPKWYTFGDKVRHKGVSKKAIRQADDGDREVYRQTYWPKIATLLRKGCLDGYFTATIEKKIDFTYTKGHVLSSGDVKPLVLREF